MNVKPLILDLTNTNTNDTKNTYFPGKYGARKQIDMNLKKFVPRERFFLKKRPIIYIQNNNIKNTFKMIKNNIKRVKNNI